jgi:hypothetical protein
MAATRKTLVMAGMLSVVVTAIGERRCSWNHNYGHGGSAEREAEKRKCDEPPHGNPLLA